MLKKFIIIENGEKYQCDLIEDIVKVLIDDDFYTMSKSDQNKIMKFKAIANCFNNNFEIIENQNSIDMKDKLENKFVIYDEITYILSLLLLNKVVLLERTDSNVFIKYLDNIDSTDNYVIVNTFAKDILQRYLIEVISHRAK